MTNIAITQDEKAIIMGILTGEYQIIAFGSRVKNNHEMFSDLDLCLKAKQPIDRLNIASLKQAFTDSNLPFRVDIVDYHDVPDFLRKIIDREGIIVD